MVEHIDLSKTLFLDIETVCEQPDYSALSETFQELWKLKCRQLARQYDVPIEDEQAAELYIDKAAIFAEFGKIICISVGVLHRDHEGKLVVRLKSFAGDDERKLLYDFAQLLQQHYGNPATHNLCGHNIKEFDIPYICRRMIVNQVALPQALNLAGKKPWETKHLIDTLELWKFGDMKHYTSLSLLAAVLNFPSPKSDIDGSKVGRVFWEEGDVERIAAYCEKDVAATVQLLLRYKGLPILEEEQIISV